ncbi:MAG: ABC transporter ATP-binding protein/permease [Gracilibacteraceae bacterium]|jgi:ATP-binding cassette subfamily B protein|nr:ABC transporter ATP-binding protein/permease [Gracilibacteraceae bacterium]
MSENTSKQTTGSAGGRPGGRGFGGGGRGFGGGHGMAEKPKDFKRTWLKLIQYSRSYIPVIIIALIIASASAVMVIVAPDILKQMAEGIEKGLKPQIDITQMDPEIMQQLWSDIQEGIDPATVFTKIDPSILDEKTLLVLKEIQDLQAKGIDPFKGAIDMDYVVGLALLLVFLFSLSAVLSFSENFIMATISARIAKKLRTRISDKINKLPLKKKKKTSYGDVLSRVTNDVDAIGMTLNQSLDMVVRAVTMFFGALFMMFITNWIMALTAVVSSLLGFGLMTVIMSRSQKYFAAQQKGLGDINGHVEEIYSGHNVVKAYNGGKEAKATFEKINANLYDSAWKSQFLSGMMMPIMNFVGNLGYVAVCVVGAALTMSNIISFGVIIAFMAYVRLFTQPLSQVAQAMQALQRGAAASERVFEFFGEAEMSDESGLTQTFGQLNGDVEFKNVHFGYDKDKPVIHNFSAQIKAGQKIAIVGPTGAGKTTIVNLLMRFYDIDSGEILLDGVPTHTVTRETVHEQFGMVLQDTWLFEGTIKENIIYSKQNITDEEVVAACKAVGLHHYIRTLPKGYDTLLDDQANMSAGQRQLLTIARAMIQNAPLLILDEATSSVDTRTERIVQDAMNKLSTGRTSFVIAHRLSTIRNADLILVIKDGDIYESGSHEALLEKGGFYAELYNSQFEETA